MQVSISNPSNAQNAFSSPFSWFSFLLSVREYIRSHTLQGLSPNTLLSLLTLYKALCFDGVWKAGLVFFCRDIFRQDSNSLHSENWELANFNAKYRCACLFSGFRKHQSLWICPKIVRLDSPKKVQEVRRFTKVP